MFNKFSHKGTICADSTFGTNKYGYKLITFSVIDDRNSGIVFLSIISSTEKSTLISSELNKFKEKIKFDSSIKYLMSDLSENFYNGWREAFGIRNSEIKWVYCNWHFTRAVNKKIAEIIKNQKLKNEIEKKL